MDTKFDKITNFIGYTCLGLLGAYMIGLLVWSLWLQYTWYTR